MKLLTVKDVAESLRVSATTVRQAAGAGALGCVRIGRRLLFTEEQLAAYIAANTRRADTGPGAPPTTRPAADEGSRRALRFYESRIAPLVADRRARREGKALVPMGIGSKAYRRAQG